MKLGISGLSAGVALLGAVMSYAAVPTTSHLHSGVMAEQIWGDDVAVFGSNSDLSLVSSTGVLRLGTGLGEDFTNYSKIFLSGPGEQALALSELKLEYDWLYPQGRIRVGSIANWSESKIVGRPHEQLVSLDSAVFHRDSWFGLIRSKPHPDSQIIRIGQDGSVRQISGHLSKLPAPAIASAVVVRKDTVFVARATRTTKACGGGWTFRETKLRLSDLSVISDADVCFGRRGTGTSLTIHSNSSSGWTAVNSVGATVSVWRFGSPSGKLSVISQTSKILGWGRIVSAYRQADDMLLVGPHRPLGNPIVLFANTKDGEWVPIEVAPKCFDSIRTDRIDLSDEGGRLLALLSGPAKENKMCVDVIEIGRTAT